jgi:hypothetical protein
MSNYRLIDCGRCGRGFVEECLGTLGLVVFGTGGLAAAGTSGLVVVGIGGLTAAGTSGLVDGPIGTRVKSMSALRVGLLVL